MDKLHFKLFPDQGLIWLWGKGELDYAEVVKAIIDINTDDNYRTNFDSFIDFGKAKLIFNPEKLREYSQFLQTLAARPEVRKWGVYTENSETTRLLNMVSKMVGDRVFFNISRDRASVLKWLGKEDPCAVGENC